MLVCEPNVCKPGITNSANSTVPFLYHQLDCRFLGGIERIFYFTVALTRVSEVLHLPQWMQSLNNKGLLIL